MPQFGFGLRQALLQGLCLALRQGQRTEDLHAFRPSQRFFTPLGAQDALKLVPTAQDLPIDPDQLGVLLARHHRFYPSFKLSSRFTGHGQAGQVVVAVGHDLGTGRQGGHFAVACVQQPCLRDHLPNALDQRRVQPIIRPFARNHITGHQLPRGFRRSRHQLHLRQIWPVVFAVPILHQTILSNRMIAVGRRAVQPHSGQFQLVHRHTGRPQRRFQPLPGFILAQALQNNSQALIVCFDSRSQRLTKQLFQRLPVAVNPILHSRFAMVPFRQNVHQPDGSQIPVAHSLVQPVVTKLAIQQFRQVEFFHDPV